MCRRVPAPNDQSRRWSLEQAPAAEQNHSSNPAPDTVDEAGCGLLRRLNSRGSAGPASNGPSARGGRRSEHSHRSRLQMRADSAGNRQGSPQRRPLRSERTAISQTGPCTHPQKSVLPEEFKRPIPSSAGRYTSRSIPALRVNARKKPRNPRRFDRESQRGKSEVDLVVLDTRVSLVPLGTASDPGPPLACSCRRSCQLVPAEPSRPPVAKLAEWQTRPPDSTLVIP